MSIANTPPSSRIIVLAPDALPTAVVAIEPTAEFWAAMIAIDTPTPLSSSGTISEE